ncbi:50S ribosomal protein L9 [Candidatus Falkowbacteria bacterium]|nr:50S ribosomal protein L9 [Candidatus Falkowbacteria bacterium]
MKVVLIKQVKTLGSPGQVKEVADGYARNFLIPGGLALPATQTVVNAWQHKANVVRRSQQQAINHAKKISKALASAVVEVRAKANAEGTLFGAVTEQQIVTGLEAAGLDLDKRYLQYQTPIKKTGDHHVGYTLANGERGTLTVRVAAE